MPATVRSYDVSMYTDVHMYRVSYFSQPVRASLGLARVQNFALDKWLGSEGEDLPLSRHRVSRFNEVTGASPTSQRDLRLDLSMETIFVHFHYTPVILLRVFFFFFFTLHTTIVVHERVEYCYSFSKQF